MAVEETGAASNPPADGSRKPSLHPQLDWRTKLTGYLGGIAVGMAVNVVSTDAGYRWTLALVALVAALSSGFWLRRLDPLAPITRWFGRAVLTAAAILAGISAWGPHGWSAYAATLAVILVIAVLARVELASALSLLVAIATIGVGVAVVAEAVRSVRDVPVPAILVAGVGLVIVKLGATYISAGRGLFERDGVDPTITGLRYLMFGFACLGSATMFGGRHPLGAIASLASAAAFFGGGLVLLRGHIVAWWRRVTSPPPVSASKAAEPDTE